MSRRFEVVARVTISLDEILDSIAYDNDDAFQLVKALDEKIGEWEFTLRLADHFDKLRAEEAKERAEDETGSRGKEPGE